MKQKNTWWFSLVIAILLTLVMILLVLYILEYIIPYKKTIKWIENSSNAFYQTEWAVEEWLYFFKWRSWTSQFNDNSTSFLTNNVGNQYSTSSKGDVIPPAYKWNSTYDKSFNTISSSNSIQLEIWNISWLTSTEIFIQAPDIDRITASLAWWTKPIINWQLSSINDTLNSDVSSLITATDINNWWSIDFFTKIWNRLWVSATQTFNSFYLAECASDCVLKISIINELKASSHNIIFPYLEYKIETNKPIPLRYSRIIADWKSYGFQKELEVRVPQQTTNQAFDFTVFQ